jgi:hypothetical protein
MMERRKLIGSAIAAGVTGLVVADAPEAAAQDDTGVINAVNSLKDSMQRQLNGFDPGASSSVVRVRQVQRMHLESARVYPAFMEVGFQVWEDLYDWHVRFQRTLDARRLADGRYVMTFMFTTIVLRPDQDPQYVSPAYDVLPRA